MTAFPRVLFVTPAAFNHLTGGGVTFSNLFAGWPKDCLATAHNDAVPTSSDICDRYFKLGRPEIDLIAPLRMARLLRDHEAAAQSVAGSGASSRPLGGFVARLQGDSAPQRARITADLERWITAFKPQLLYTILGSNAFMSLAAAIRRRFALPMVVHLMDDFPSVAYRRGLFAATERARMRALLAENLGAATTCMAICVEMCDAFSQRYGRPFLAFQNCVDIERWRGVVRNGSATKRPDFRLLYFGSVFADVQLASLVDLCRSVVRLRAAGMPVTFDIASPAAHLAAHRAALAIDPAIRLTEPTQDDGAFFAALAAADALVLPLNHDAGTVNFIRYSMPTKVPAYMASGTPILVYGPGGVAQVDYAAREGWGLVVSERAPQTLDAALRRILSDERLRETLHQRAQALACEHHDTARVRARFQDALRHAAGMATGHIDFSRMKQVLLTRAGVEVREVPEPQVEPGAVLVRVSHSCISVGTEMSGVRESDLPLWKRALRRPDQVRRLVGVVATEGLDTARAAVRNKLAEAQPVGYSAVGRAIACGDAVADIAVGDRVACAGAQSAHHAEIICVPRNLCVAVPEAVSDRDAATVTLGAIALQGVRRLQPTLGEAVVVIGLGAIGQITVQLLKSAGARTIGVEIDRRRLEEAAALGLDAGVHPDDVDPVAQAARLTDGHGADGVIVTAASPSSKVLSAAFCMCRRKARVVLVGDVGLNLDRADIYPKELDFLISTSYGPGRYDRGYEESGLDYPIAYVRWTENRNMAEYLRQIADGRVRLDGAAEVFPVERAGEAYRALSDPAKRPLFAYLAYPAHSTHPAHGTSGGPPIHRGIAQRSAERRGGATAVRLALIGAGSFAKSMHLPLLQKMRADFTLQAIVSRRGHEADALARQYGAAFSATDIDTVLDSPDVEAVLIATRHDSHADLVIRALERGKHVLVEKPLCLTPAELGAIEAAVERLGDRCPVLMTGFNRRFSPHAGAMKALTDRRSQPFIADYRVNAGHIPLDHWVHGAAGGGRNIGEACHFYDLIGHIAGAAVTTIEARAIRPNGGHYARNDNFVALLTFADGSIASLTYTALGSVEVPKERFDIYCDGRVLQIVDFREFIAAGCKAEHINRPDKGHAGELVAFARAVRGEAPWPIPLAKQAQAMRIAFRVEELLRRGAAAGESAPAEGER